MGRPDIKLLLFIVAAGLPIVRVAYAAPVVVKTANHDAAAHNLWQRAEEDKWRKHLRSKRSAKKSLLITVQTR